MRLFQTMLEAMRTPLLVLSAVCFGIGITTPLIRLEKFFLFEETPSLVAIISGLWADQAFGIAFLVALFSIALPLAKLLVCALAIGKNTALPVWIALVSKWSMMDVLLVAIVIFAAKTSGIATAFTQPGIWFYTASTLLLAIAGNSATVKVEK